MSCAGDVITLSDYDMDDVEPVFHEQKLFCVNGQMVIDRECQEHPIHCYARNIARKFYNPELSHKDEKKEYGISRTDIVTINIEGTEKEIERVRKNLKNTCAKCTHRSK